MANDATDPSTPILLARKRVQRGGQSSFGVTKFCFANPVAVTPGKRYFIALETPDGYGLGLTDQLVSTYPDGGEGVLFSTGLQIAERDTSFSILSKSCTP